MTLWILSDAQHHPLGLGVVRESDPILGELSLVSDHPHDGGRKGVRGDEGHRETGARLPMQSYFSTVKTTDAIGLMAGEFATELPLGRPA